MDRGDTIKSWGTIIVTALVAIIVIGWILLAVLPNLGRAPVYNSTGTLAIDEYSRAKDILVLILPLLTTAVGYWLGSQGTAKAEDRAKKAEDQKSAVLSVSADGALEKARKANPDAFK